MAWLHTWSGLLVGWILFAVFATGTATYFRNEISQYMRPELQASEQSLERTAQLTFATLQRIGAGSPTWFIGMPDERDPGVTVFYRRQGSTQRRFDFATLDPATGEPVEARGTRGGEFFYRFHFELHMQPLWGRWIVSFCAMMMLVAIISGIITHRRIFADFFTFRPGKAAGRSWLDAHNAFAVLALPYHLMITYTGLITLMLMTMPWGAQVVYKGDTRAFFNEAIGAMPAPRPARQAAPLADPGPMVAAALREWGSIGRITVNLPGDAHALVQVSRGDGDRLSANPQTMVFNGVTGAHISTTPMESAAAATRGVTYGLHQGRFARPVMRALFFLSGLAGCAMVATGLVLWAAKIRQKQTARKRRTFGLWLVDSLNVGAVAGLPFAMAAFFHANRLLPLHIEDRQEWEVKVFFAAWVLTLVHAMFRRIGRAWIEVFALAAIAALALPLVNFATTGRHLGVSLLRGDVVMAGMDLGFVFLGLLFAAIARKLWLRDKAPAPVRKSRVPRPAASAPAEVEPA